MLLHCQNKLKNGFAITIKEIWAKKNNFTAYNISTLQQTTHAQSPFYIQIIRTAQNIKRR